MAGRATYTKDDKSRVYVVLAANDGNVKRTARETGIPENTVRRWRDEWQKNGPPPAEEVETALGDFVSVADDVRFLALKELKRLISEGKAKAGELNNTIGILTDKIDRARGLDVRRVDVQHHLPSPEEALALVQGFTQSLRQLSAAREAEIVDAEIVEQPALPAGK